MSWSAPTTLATNSDTTSATSKTKTGLNASVDTLVIVAGRISSGGAGLTGLTVSDSSSNTWTLYQTGTGSDRWFIASTVIATGKALSGGSITVTRTGTTNITGNAFCIVSFTGSVTSSQEDTAVRQTAGNTTGYSPSVTGGTAANSGDLVIALCAYLINTPASFSYTEDSGNGWATAASVSGTNFAAIAYQTNSGTGAKTHAPTISGANPGSDKWYSKVTAFIAAGGSPPAANTNLLMMFA